MHLLKKTIRSYFIFSALLIVAAVPVFFYALKQLMIINTDEHLMASKTRIISQLQNVTTNQPAGTLSLPDYDVAFEKELRNNSADSIYDDDRKSNTSRNFLPGRTLSSHVNINQEFYNIRIKTSTTDRGLLITRIIFLLVILLITMFLGLLVVNRMITKKTWLPFYSTLKHLQHYHVDKEAIIKLGKTGITEFDDLNDAIQKLTETNSQAYSAQKEFTENASHEMQSPLAVFQSKLELLMQTKPLNEEQASLIGDLADASKRMIRLNKSLLVLTKIENNQYVEKEQVFIEGIVHKLIEQFNFQIEQQALTINFNPVTDLIIESNRTLIEILVSNLLSNAIRYNRKDGRIEIILTAKQLVIRNTGIGRSLNPTMIFKRFQKQGNDPAGLGLGLELIKKICTLNHFDIRYEFRDNLHSFLIDFHTP